MTNPHDIKLAEAAMEVAQWLEGTDSVDRLAVLGHDPATYSSIAETITDGFVNGLMAEGPLKYLKPQQVSHVRALATTCWELGASAAELAYGLRERTPPGMDEATS